MIFLVVYIPPTANAVDASDVIHTVVAGLQTRHPDAFIAISGDFNHITLAATLPTFKQFVDCPTRENKTLDLLYANVKDAYSSTALPPLGKSDHNLIHLQPLYKPQVQRLPVTTRTVRRWSQETDEALQGCFELTDWELLCDSHGEDLDDLTDCITGYINFCVDSVVPTVTVRCFPNNKPWVTRDIKVLLNEKKRAFRDRDREQMRRVQRRLKERIQQGKDSYRMKLERKLQQNNLKDVWSGMRSITGYKTSGSQTIGGGTERANELNLFFNRFDERAPDYPSPSSSTTIHLQTSSPAAHPPFLPDYTLPVLSPPTITSPHPLQHTRQTDLRKELCRLRPGKAAGPDGVSQPKGPQNMCNPAELSSAAHLQPEPESGEGPCTVEDILPGTCTEEGASQHPQRLQTGGTDVSPDEVPGEAGPVTSSALGQLIIGPSSVCLPAETRCGGRHHLPAPPCLRPPGQSGKHCENPVLGLLQCVRHHPACSAGE